MARLAKGNAVTMQRTVVVEQAHAKVNLVLRVGPPRADGLHPLCSLFAALELADEVTVGLGAAATDEVLFRFGDVWRLLVADDAPHVKAG